MIKYFLRLAFFSLSSLCLYAQNSEVKAWSTIEYGVSLNNKWSLDISQHLRLKEDLAVIDNYITQTEVYFKPAKRWKIAGQMRYYYRNDNQGGIQGYENMLRYRLGVEKKFKLKPGNLELRLAYQNRFSLDRENRFKKALRFRPLFEWKIKNWAYDPKFYFEYIQELEGDEQQSYRFGVGSKIKVTKTQGISLRYFYQKSTYALKQDLSTHVISLKYAFKKAEQKEAKKEKKKEDA